MSEVKMTKSSCFLGETLKLSNGFLTLEVTLDVGPRIISLQKEGEENILFHDVDDAVNKDVSSVYGAGKAWHIYGGHRIWLSPEDLTTYYPDNGKVNYHVTESGSVVFTPQAWEVQNVQTALEITFIGEKEVAVTMHATNTGKGRKLCIWGLTVCKPDATSAISLSTEDTGFLANRNLVLWPYTKLNDERLQLFDDKILLNSSSKATCPLKVGIYKEDACIVYERGNTRFTKRFYGKAGAEYPDYHCNLEAYTSNLIHEVESLSSLTYVENGETLTHTEWWTVE